MDYRDNGGAQRDRARASDQEQPGPGPGPGPGLRTYASTLLRVRRRRHAVDRVKTTGAEQRSKPSTTH